MALLEINELDVYYGEVQVLHQVSLEVGDGELVGVVGSNGAGKTTLLKAISRLIEPSGGTIAFEGHPLNQMTAPEVVNLGLIHVPEGRRLFPYLTVRDNLLLGGYAPRARDKRPQSLEQAYQIFPRLEERSGQKAGTLSGGEQQMLAIARALMGRPRLIMLDEPSLGLAPLLVEEILSVVERINEQGVTVLLVEQNVQECLSLAERAYVLENGRIIQEGTGEEMLKSERVRQAYLGL
jgi:branched-chain amino acid transport system ATP-binding protein